MDTYFSSTAAELACWAWAECNLQKKKRLIKVADRIEIRYRKKIGASLTGYSVNRGGFTEFASSPTPPRPGMPEK